jgi:D-alanyl-D-alanine carboxypeptidase/D-alanyl-D-alanine-endopeptidase (penicillin-binding protein 4)
MARRFLVLGLALAASLAATAAGQEGKPQPQPQPQAGRYGPFPEAAVAEFRDRLDKRLAPLARQGIAYGVRIIALPGGEPIYAANAEGLEKPIPGGGVSTRLFAPASNMKLITTAAALDLFGRDHAFKTTLAVRGDDLVVVGGGDPSFGDAAIEGVKGPVAELAKWAAALKAKGVTSVAGGIVVDDSHFDGEFVHPNWPRDQLNEWFCAPVGGLNLNTNCVEVVIAERGAGARFNLAGDWLTLVNQAKAGGAGGGVSLLHGKAENEIILRGSLGAIPRDGVSVTIRDPGLFFGNALRKVLIDNGISVAGPVRRERVRAADGSLPAGVNVVAVHETPLPTVLARCNKRSQNLYAECLIKSLGAAWTPGAAPPPPDADTATTWGRGSLMVRRFLGKLHLPDEGVRILDGSGLSRENAVSPMLLTELLRYMHGAPDAEVFRESLAVGGVDGTLAKRMRDAGVRGNVLAKTGFIRGVSGLSGYVRTAQGWIAFSMLFNDVKGSTSGVKEMEDEICRDLIRIGGGPPLPPPPEGAVPAPAPAPAAAPKKAGTAKPAAGKK